MEKDNEIKEKTEIDENVAYKIEFNRLNEVAIISGVIFIFMAILNMPFLYNPELGTLTTELIGKPTMGIGAALRAYVWLGILPLIIGLIFILFALLQSRKIILLMYKNGKCRQKTLLKAKKHLKQRTGCRIV